MRRASSRVILFAACLALMVFAGTVLHAAGFEKRLSEIETLWKSQQFVRLADLLVQIGPADTLEDLRCYLLGEALRQSGRETEAIGIFERLQQRFPDSWFAKKGTLSYVLLAAKQKGAAAFDLLATLARDLPTPSMRGRALEGLIDLKPPATRESSQVAFEALRAYRSESWFHQDVAEMKGLLERIFTSLQSWRFSRDEWIELARKAGGIGLGKNVLAALPSLKPVLGAHADALAVILEADMLRYLGQKDRAAHLLTTILAIPSIEPGLRALAYQIRGDLLSTLNRHPQAAEDFARAAQFAKPPVDEIAARYRLMRSAFEAGDDRQAENAANWLVVNVPKMPLLPIHLFEMAQKRYDQGNAAAALPLFQLLFRGFPGHYRADDGMGYAAVCAGSTSKEGQALLKQLAERYPHSFFGYWLYPESRNSQLSLRESLTPQPDWVRLRVPAWQILYKGPFSALAREEVFNLLDRYPVDLGFYKAIIETAAGAGDHFQAIAYAERLFRNWLDAGRPVQELPLWAWRAHYPRPYLDRVQAEARRYGLDPAWVYGIMREESHFNPGCLSRSNAMGLMQILPSTGKWIAEKLGIKGRFNKDSLWNTDRNIAFGCWYLNYLRDLFNGDLFLGAAAYNGGQGNIKRKVEEGPYAHLPVFSRLDRVPLPETRDYYKKVMGSWWAYRRLYK